MPHRGFRARSFDLAELEQSVLSPSKRARRRDFVLCDFHPTLVWQDSKATNTSSPSLPTSEQVDPLAVLLGSSRTSFPALKALRLCHVGLSDTRGASEVARLLQSPGSRLERLDLTFNRLGPLGVQKIASALPLSRVKVLLLGRNEIQSRGVQALCDVLAESAITTLDLRLNDIDDVGLKALSASLAMCPALRRLNLGANSFSSEAVEAFCAGAVHSRLESLSLSECDLRNECLPSIATMIRTMGSLETLDLSGNVYLHNVEPLLAAVTGHFSMRKIVLTGTSVTREDAERLNMRLEALHSKRSEVMVALCSSKIVPRLVSGGAGIASLPIELFRLIAEAL